MRRRGRKTSVRLYRTVILTSGTTRRSFTAECRNMRNAGCRAPSLYGLPVCRRAPGRVWYTLLQDSAFISELDGISASFLESRTDSGIQKWIGSRHRLPITPHDRRWVTAPILSADHYLNRKRYISTRGTCSKTGSSVFDYAVAQMSTLAVLMYTDCL